MPLDELWRVRARIFGSSRLRSVGWLTNSHMVPPAPSATTAAATRTAGRHRIAD